MTRESRRGPRALSDTLAMLLLRLLLLMPMAGSVDADDHGVVFLFPTPNMTFYYMDTVNVAYTSNFPQPNIYIFCDSGNRLVYSTPSPPNNGSVLLPLNFTSSTPCYFDLRPGTVPGQGANSPKFTLVGVSRAETTVGLQPSATSAVDSTASPTTSSSTTTATTANAGATTTTSTSADTGTSSNSGGGLSGGAAAGVGIGVAVAAIAVAGAVAAWIWMKKRRAKASAAQARSGAAYNHDDDAAFSGPRELSSSNTPASHHQQDLKSTASSFHIASPLSMQRAVPQPHESAPLEMATKEYQRHELAS